MIALKSYVLSEFKAGHSDGNVNLLNPTTEEVVATTSTKGFDFKAVLEHARTVGGPALRAMTFAQRGEMLKAMSKSLHEVRDALIEVSVQNAGTTRSDSKFDVDGAIGTLAYYAGLGQKLGDAKFLVEGAGEQLTRGARFWGKHIQTPRHGVAVHINAFNFPAWGLAEKAAVALLAGMPVVTKPATSTALPAFRLMERLVESKVMPAGVLQFVCGSVGDLLSHLGPQDVMAFTGGGSTGTQLRGLPNLLLRSVRVNVEADSLNSTVLGHDIDVGGDTWQMFLRDVVREMTQKTGQKCTATRRIFVPADRIDEVQSEVAARLGEIKVGDPALDDVRMGPLATAQQLRDFRAGIASLVESGARVVHGSATECNAIGVPAGKGFFVAPMLLRADKPASATRVHEHEVFGPSATIMPYATNDEAVALVGRGEGSLVASLYTDDRATLETVVLGMAAHSGRVLVGSTKVADQAISPGLVLPSCVHGGPGRAGGGEELGGERGLSFYMQRTAVQGDRALLDRAFATPATPTATP